MQEIQNVQPKASKKDTQVERLTRHIKNLSHQSWIERWSAAYSLGELRNPIAVDPLIMAIRDRDFDVRRAVVEALGKIGDQKATPYIISALDDPEKEVKIAAIRALGKLKDRRATKPLIEFLKFLDESDYDLRKFAIHQLGEIGDPSAVDILLELLKDPSVSQYVIRALVKIGEEAVDPLLQALNDRDPVVRKLSCFALGKIRSFRAVDHLIEKLKDEDREVQEEAIRALGRIADKKAVDHLVEILESDKFLQLQAALALKRLGDMRGKQFLEEKARGRIFDNLREKD